jgi:homoserine dehydrogenase
MRSIRLGLLGAGTVGGGVLKILQGHGRLFARRLGLEFEIVKVATKDAAQATAIGIPAERVTGDAMSVALDPNVDIVVELMGGLEPARSVVEAALRAGKHVVTANKALLAHHGAELFAVADEVGRELAYEASVGGSIPIIRALKEGYVADNVVALYGIVNGTCNYILSTMTDAGADFGETLADAQRMGYAEADPTFDVEGIDSAHKVAILAMLAYGVRFDYKQIPTEGITKISKADIDFARRFGYKIKLTAIARMQDGKLDIRVHPSMLPAASQLAQVQGVFNAIYLEGDNVGSAMLYGRGAGSLPTASAVMSDVAAIARRLDVGGHAPNTGYMPGSTKDVELLPGEAIESDYYLRLTVRDVPGVLGQIATVLGKHKISIASMLQEGRSEGDVPLVILTHTAREGDLLAAIQEIEGLQCTSGNIAFLRVLQNLS